MKYIKVGDLEICYEIKGSGHPLVLIMGFTANMDWWDPEFIDALAERYKVLFFDNRGAGRTVTPAEGDFTTEMFAGDTALLMEELGIERAHVFGFSMGGIIAQLLALRYPGRVSRLVLGGTFCGGKETVMASPEVTKVLMDNSGGIEGMFDRSASLMFPQEYLDANPGFIRSFRERYLKAPANEHNTRRQFIASMKTGTYNELPGLNVPVLVATGASDILIPPRNSHILAERIPGARLVEYENSRHCFMSTARERFLSDLMEFLG